MRQGSDVAAWIAVAILLIFLLAASLWFSPLGERVATRRLAGVVLVADQDPQKEVPLPEAEIRVAIDGTTFVRKSDAAGYFQMVLPRTLREQGERLTVTQTAYQTMEANHLDTDHLLIARLKPLAGETARAKDSATLIISNVRIRSTVKAENTVNVGSIVKTFAVPNVGNEACGSAAACSPDGKWKAAITRATYDAGESNQFIDIRASCIAGPCPFTKIVRSNISNPVRKMDVSVLNWSDTATYLIEAEVSRTMMSDMVREAFPAIFGNSMDFTLPAAAEGPSIEADLNGTSIVFPLGPNLLLSWATCTAAPAPEHTRLFRCELKPGFAFR